jgi:hypothetical protein
MGKMTLPPTIEKLFIYKETKEYKHLDDKHTISYNNIFEAILNKESRLTSFPTSSPINTQHSTTQ